MDLERLFYPRSVAAVGASPNFNVGKAPYFQMLKGAGYAGRLYPVNPAHREIEGAKVYASLEEVPEAVDLAIISVPARLAQATLESAVKKGVKFVHFFTSGFSEIGNDRQEAELVAAARKGGTRIVGPNCLGILCPESRLTFDPSIMQDGPGTIAFLGQSGGVTNEFARVAQARKIGLNKVVSYGNQIDLRVEDFLEYFAGDERIKVIAAYIEDVKDPRAFMSALKKITPHKPVIVLKGGRTAAGAVAARSHTGAMAGSYAIWSAVMRQTGCLEVQTPEAMVDAVMLAASPRLPAGPRVGFLGAGGGNSVVFTDLAVSHGLSLPELSSAAQLEIAGKIPGVNTSARNPVDLGAYGFDYNVMVHTLRVMAADERLDAILPLFALDFVGWFPDEMLTKGWEGFAEAARELQKPVVPVLVLSSEDDLRLTQLRLKAFAIFRAAGLPVFDNLPAAVLALKTILAWTGKRATAGE